jgi:hypothetical protein
MVRKGANDDEAVIERRLLSIGMVEPKLTEAQVEHWQKHRRGDGAGQRDPGDQPPERVAPPGRKGGIRNLSRRIRILSSSTFLALKLGRTVDELRVSMSEPRVHEVGRLLRPARPSARSWPQSPHREVTRWHR